MLFDFAVGRVGLLLLPGLLKEEKKGVVGVICRLLLAAQTKTKKKQKTTILSARV